MAYRLPPCRTGLPPAFAKVIGAGSSSNSLSAFSFSGPSRRNCSLVGCRPTFVEPTVVTTAPALAAKRAEQTSEMAQAASRRARRGAAARRAGRAAGEMVTTPSSAARDRCLSGPGRAGARSGEVPSAATCRVPSLGGGGTVGDHRGGVGRAQFHEGFVRGLSNGGQELRAGRAGGENPDLEVRRGGDADLAAADVGDRLPRAHVRADGHQRWSGMS